MHFTPYGRIKFQHFAKVLDWVDAKGEFTGFIDQNR